MDTTVVERGLTVVERGLVTEKLKWKDIVKHHNLYSKNQQTVKQFAGISLGYVTPVCVEEGRGLW